MLLHLRVDALGLSYDKKTVPKGPTGDLDLALHTSEHELLQLKRGSLPVGI
jgi:hypothetical protein